MTKTETLPQSATEAFHELSYHTLSLEDSEFIHQYIVDAFAAQTANETTKPIAITFALVGLYLHIERNFTGREVQKAHMQLARTRKQWPTFDFPVERGTITVFDVLRTPPGADRYQAINRWMISVWETWKASHVKVAELVKAELYR